MAALAAAVVSTAAWVYQANGPAPGARKVEAFVAVAPFEDEREYFALDDAPRAYYRDEDAYAYEAAFIAGAKEAPIPEPFPVLYARWLAQELSAAGCFLEARFMTWPELAAAAPRPRWVVAGTLKPRRTSVLPIELRLLDARKPLTPLWSREYTAWKDLPIKHWPVVAAATASSLRREYAEARDDLCASVAKEASP